jgi:phosphate:Na+ symporter
MSATLVTLNLCGAVGLLLFGLSQIKSGVTRVFGARLRHFLSVSTRTGPRALLAGFGVTLALQSSTATALLAASFAERRMLSTRAGLIVMLGANFGTAVTAWIVSFNLSWLSPLAILIGYVLTRSSTPAKSGTGKAVMGLGLLLLALHLLDTSSEPIRQSPALAAFLVLLGGAPIVAIGFAALIAFLSTSSLAAVMMIASLTSASGFGIELVLPLVLGANIGGALPPILAALGARAKAQRLAFGNLFVRTVGAVALLGVVSLMPDHIMAPLTQITGNPITTHLAFNALLICAIWPFCGLIAKLFKALIPSTPATEKTRQSYLSDDAISTPTVALASALREALGVGDVITDMLNTSMEAFQTGDISVIAQMSAMENQVDTRQQEIKIYVARLSQQSLTEQQSKRSSAIIDYAINLEHIGDIIEKGLAPMLRKRTEAHLSFSQAGYDELLSLFSLTLDNIKAAQTVFATQDFDLARTMIEAKVDVRQIEQKSSQAHIERLRAGDRDSLETSALHLDMLRDLKRINAHIISVAHPILDDYGVLADSRLTLRDDQT